jgi:ABC-type phosphate transport system auxiliary subunit
MENLTPAQEDIQKGRLSYEEAEKEAEYLKQDKKSWGNRYDLANDSLEKGKVVESVRTDFIEITLKVKELINKLQSLDTEDVQTINRAPLLHLEEALKILDGANNYIDKSHNKLNSAGIELKK